MSSTSPTAQHHQQHHSSPLLAAVAASVVALASTPSASLGMQVGRGAEVGGGGLQPHGVPLNDSGMLENGIQRPAEDGGRAEVEVDRGSSQGAAEGEAMTVATQVGPQGDDDDDVGEVLPAGRGHEGAEEEEDDEDLGEEEEEEEEDLTVSEDTSASLMQGGAAVSMSSSTAASVQVPTRNKRKNFKPRNIVYEEEDDDEDDEEDDDDREDDEEGRVKMNSTTGGHGMPLDLSLMRKMGGEEDDEELEEDEEEFDEDEEEDDDGGGRGSYSSGSGAEGVGGGGLDLSSNRSSSSRRKCLYPPVRMVSGREGSVGMEEGGASSSASSSPAPGVGAPSLSHPPPPSSAAFAAFSQALHRFGFPPHGPSRASMPHPDSAMKEYAESTMKELLGIYGLGDASDAASRNAAVAAAAAAAGHGFASGSAQSEGAGCGHGGGGGQQQQQQQQQQQFDNIRHKMADSVAKLAGLSPNSIMGNPRVMLQQDMATILTLAALQEQKAAAAAVNMGAEASNGQLSSSPGGAGSPAVGGPQGAGSSVKVPAPPIDYSRYVKRFSSAAECGSYYCRDLNYREHFHCLDCNSRVFVKKEEMIRHFKWHKKRDESLQHGFMRYSPMDDCSDRFRDCSHNRKQTHYHCLKEGCEKVYISTSDVQMHANYHRKDSAIIQEGFQRYRATEDCASPHCSFYGQRTTHFHCRRSNCKFTFKNKADMEKHKTYHIKDEQLNRDGFKKFMKHEHCSFENCRFSRVCNHIHCIRLGCSYVLHSSGQLYSHKRKHERKDNEMAYRKFKLAQSMLKSFGGGGGMDCGGMPGMGQSAATSPHDFSSMDSMFAERVGSPPLGQGGRIQGITPDTSSSPVAPSAIQTSVIQGPSALRPSSPQQQPSQPSQQSQDSQEPGLSSPGRSSPEGMPNGLPPGPQGLAAFHKYSSVFGGLDCIAPPGMPSPFLIGTPGGTGAGVPVGAVAGYTPPPPHLLSQTSPGCEPHPSSSASSAVDLSHGDFRAGPVTVSAMMQQQHQASAAAATAARHFPLLPDDLWRKYLTCHRAGEKCGGRGAGPNAVCEFLGKEHFHCMAEGCDMTFRSKDGVREHARNHEQQEQVTEAFYWTVEVGQEPCRPCPPDCPFQNKEKHYHCCWENCREIILPTDKPFRRLDHYKMHEYSRKLSLTKDPMTMTLATSIDGMFRRKRGRPPKNRVIEVWNDYFPMPSTPGTMDVPQAIFASFKLPKPASISASVAQSPPFGMAPMSQGMRMGPMTGTPNPSPPSSSPPRPAPPLSAPPTGSTSSSGEKPLAQVQEGFFVFGEGSPCPDGPLCPYCSRRHFHCTQPRCFYVTDREDILIMHSKDFHDNIDIMEGFVFFDRTIDCRLPSCHSNKVNRHFHCTRPNCGYSFVRYSTMAVHEQKHREEEESGGTVVAAADAMEGEEERWEGPGGECTPNGGAEKRVSPLPSSEREDTTSLSKGFALQNPNPVIRLPCTPTRPGQLSPSTGTTVVKAAGTFYPLSAFSSGRPHGKAAKHEIQTSPRPSPSPTAPSQQPSTSSPTRSSSSAASSSASSSPPPAPPIPPPAPPLRLAVAAWHSPVAGVGRDGTVMTDGGEGSPDASQPNSLANLLQKIPAESAANQNVPLQQQQSPMPRPECWMDVERHVRYGPEHSCSRPFCKLKRKEHYHCIACNQAFSELERLRPHIQKHAGGALSPDSSCIPLAASPGPRTKDASVGTVVIKTEQENGGDVDGEDGGGSTDGGPSGETAESSQRSSPQPAPEEHGPPMWARAGPVVGGDPAYPHHFALANPFALVTSRGMPFVGPGMPAIYSSPTGLMFAPALPALRPPQGSSPGSGVMGEPGDSSVLQQQHPFNSLHRPSLLGKRSSPTAPLHAPLHHLHLSSPHHQFLPPPPNPPSHNPPSPLSVALHNEALSPEAKKARIQSSMRILKDEPVPDGYIRFRFNEDCKYPHCGYREHQTHFHCMRPDCGYSFCDKTRFVQHTARHERLDTLMGGDFQQFRANVPCGRPDCAYTSTLGSMQNKASHFHCLKCEFVCTDTNKVVAHRRQHQKLDSIMAAGFEKFTPSQTCQVEGCAHSQKQTHYHCLSCHYAVLGLSQMSAHKYRHLE